MPALLIISGAPCSGKSTLARQLRATLGWPLLAKDVFKETLFDTLGAGDRVWSKRLSSASYALLFQAADELLASGSHCIVEGNFRWSENAARFTKLRDTHPQSRWLEIFCDAPTELLIARYRERLTATPRHAGHVDGAAATEIEAELHACREPLPLCGAKLMFDSSNVQADALTALLLQVRRWASEDSGTATNQGGK